MVATANRHATNAAFEILKAGGNAVDAAIAAQLVLGLTEPQSSGIGGGAFILHCDARTNERTDGRTPAIRAYDGRETAPASAQANRFTGADGKLLSYAAAVGSGLSVGVPGALRVMELAHHRNRKKHAHRSARTAAQGNGTRDQRRRIHQRLHRHRHHTGWVDWRG